MPRRGLRDAARRADGSAVVEFVAVVPLLMLVVLAVVQVGLVLHVRATLTAAAAEGARVAAVSGGDVAAGAARVRAALDGTLADGVVQEVVGTRTVQDGVTAYDLQVRATLPLIGLLGPAALVVHGHALAEP